MKRLSRSVLEPASHEYMDYLREIEAGLYDANEVLQEERLAQLQSLPLPPPLQQRLDHANYHGLIRLLVAPGLIRYGLRRIQARWQKRA
jgi:hypothetical protein